MNLQLKRADKLKRDYIVYYTYTCYIDEDCYDKEELARMSEDDKVFGSKEEKTYIIKQCYTTDEAYSKFYDIMDTNIIKDQIWDYRIEAEDNTKERIIKNEIYELVLEELFESEFGVYEWVDIDDDEEYEEQTEADGVYKILIEHEAYNRFMNSK
jgi:hypothetical protein